MRRRIRSSRQRQKERQEERITAREFVATASSEHLEQVAFFEWIEVAQRREPRLAATFAVPNGAHLARGAITFNTLREEGLRPGVPDVFIPIPKEGFHGLFLEFKYGANKLSGEQERWIQALISLGYCVRVPYSCDEAIDAVKQYLRWDLPYTKAKPN